MNSRDVKIFAEKELMSSFYYSILCGDFYREVDLAIHHYS